MTIKIREHVMHSELTTHVAVLGPDGWVLSWLPQRRLTRDQATTAMVLAEALVCATDREDPVWRHVANWVEELGVTEDELPSAPDELGMAAQGGDR